ncbi:hypothetical protein KY084_02950 [Stakelama sp. CBK3Z-3]|uniref:DUF350 domain-containing protein n=1 Tax=Stakelama flava TaxID=2860338 RepID=A0ABS6XJ35_9SPHN|nr:hypothetical protein [Stakelama flava]MBW4329833.1 hypothetical protein [Stakelama flava]
MSLLLDLANILGGFLLAIALLEQSPKVGDDLARGAGKLAPFGWIIGIVALVAGGYFVIVHLTTGPALLHYEVVGILVGVALLWDRLKGRSVDRAIQRSGTTGSGLVLAIFGIIAILVGLQGLFTPNA